jgi:hypothetical protein
MNRATIKLVRDIDRLVQVALSAHETTDYALAEMACKSARDILDTLCAEMARQGRGKNAVVNHIALMQAQIQQEADAAEVRAIVDGVPGERAKRARNAEDLTR